MNLPLLAQFSGVSLCEGAAVPLMNRVDTKYLIPRHQLNEIMVGLKPHYNILELQHKRIFRYDTLYFDTPARLFYHQHLRGKLSRYKIRTRRYVDTDTDFFEIKHKNNKHRTIKNRIQIPDMGEYLCRDSRQFLSQHLPHFQLPLEPTLWVYYHRFTLINKHLDERLTFDINVWFRWQQQSIAYPHMVVAELKQDFPFYSPFVELMKQVEIRAGGISKYCLGMSSLEPALRNNAFKPTISKINHLHEY